MYTYPYFIQGILNCSQFLTNFFSTFYSGATHSKLVICDENGETVASVSGPGTNHWQLGIPECAKRIAEMVNDAKEKANIPLSLELDSLGLSLSGCEQVRIHDITSIQIL